MKIIANNADDIFDKVYNEIITNGIDVNNTLEIINANIVLTDPTKNTMLKCKRNMSIRYAIGELLWYQSRNNTYKSISNFSKFWEKLQNDDGTINSNYGWCIHDKYEFDQWEYVYNLLKTYPDTRQAILHIKCPQDTFAKPTLDVNCTLTLQFLLRNNKLDLIVTMRSNDIWLGLPYDLFNFTCLQILMAMELNVDIGTYYHNVGSMHIYKNNILKEDIDVSNTRRS